MRIHAVIHKKYRELEDIEDTLESLVALCTASSLYHDAIAVVLGTTAFAI